MPTCRGWSKTLDSNALALYTPVRNEIPIQSTIGGPVMLTVLGSPRRLCDGWTRRETLRAGALSLVGGLSLPQLLAAEARKPATRQKAKHVIVLNLLGGAA